MKDEHRDNKRLIDSVHSTAERRELIERCALDDINTQILLMRHIEFKPFDYIADTIGLSLSQVCRRYRYASQMLSDVIRDMR